MKERILLINDLPGFGKVALSAMTPILSYMGFCLYQLPTALVSNTLDFGKFHILETTEYMKNTWEVWENLGFSFDAVCTGFMASKEQAKWIAELCIKEKAKGVKVFVDPIMADHGKLYNGISSQMVEAMIELCSVSDVMMPNFTEATFLTGICEGERSVSEKEIEQILDKLHSLSKRSVVITSVHVEKGNTVAGFDADCGESFRIPFQKIPVRVPGSGDIFSAVLTGMVLQGASLKKAVAKAVYTVERLIETSQNNIDFYKGLSIEKELDTIFLD